EAMFELFEKGEPIDLVTVTTLLSNNQKLEIAGGVNYLTDVASSVPTAANIDYYCSIVEEKAVLRRLIQSATDIVMNTISKEEQMEEVLDEAEKTILEITSLKNVKTFKPIKDVLIKFYNDIEQLHHREDDVTDVPTGYRDLDRMT